MNSKLQQTKRWMRIGLQLGMVLAVVLAGLVPQGTARAAASLSVTPITWNVVGLDSNDVNAGPNNFPVGVRVCNTGDVTLYDLTPVFTWDSADAYIDLRAGSYGSATGDPYPEIASLAASTCTDVYYEVTVTRNSSAYDHTREYHIAVSAAETDDGAKTVTASTPEPREIYVEHLISQSRNYTYTVYLGTTEIPAGGTMDLMVGNTYEITLQASTATNGYEQIESFINFKNTIFRINSVETTYTANDLTSPDPDAGNKLYADGCSWEDNPLSPNYRSCLDTGKYGGDVTVKYSVTIISGGGTTETLSNLIYDFSGSSYHYNADLAISPRYADILDPSAINITKRFAPTNITPGGTAEMTIVINNPSDGPISGVNFTDTFPTLPGAMVTANTTTFTSGCGTPALVAPIGDSGFNADAASMAFSNGTIAANGTCIIKINVTAPIADASTYDNTTGNLYINGNVDTGNTASASLLVSETQMPPIPETCAVPTLMAQWDMENGVGANGSPLVTSTQPDVNTALASYYTQAGAQVVSTGIHGNLTNAWGGTAPTDSDGNGSLDSGWAETANSMQNYFQFVIDTSEYNGVYVIFDAVPANNGDWANPNSQVFVNTSTDGANFAPYIPAPITPKGKWATNIVAIANETSPGDTTIRFGVDSGSKPTSTFYMDNVTFWGCKAPTPLTAPTVSKSFSPDPVAVEAGSSTLTLTITNPDASAASILTGIRLNDFLPQETLFGLVAVTNGSTAVTGTGTQFTSQLQPGSIITLPADPVALTGTLEVTNGSTTVTGTGTAFSSELAAGDTVIINAVQYQVLSVASNTSLTLATPYRGVNSSGQTGATYQTYTVASITDDTHLTLSSAYTGTTGTTTLAAGLTLAGTPTTTCGSPVVGVSGGSAISLTGTPLSGTIAINNGSTTVTGTGSAFLSEIGAGRILRLPFQLAGTVAATTGSFTITGTDTAFSSELAVGDMLRISGEDYYVAAISGNTSLTLATPFRGTTGTGLTAQGYRNYTVQSVDSDTQLTLSTNYVSAAALSGYTATIGLAGASDTCTITVPVQANLAGTLTNATDLIYATESGENTTSSGYAKDDLTSVLPPVISKNFSSNPIPSGGTSTLTFSIINPNPTYTMTGVAFSDTYPSGLTNTDPVDYSTTCTDGSVTASAGGNSISLSDATIAAGDLCTVAVEVTATPAVPPASYVNTSGSVSHIINGNTVTGNTATDTLVVNAVRPGISLQKQVGTTASGPWYSTATIIPEGSDVYYRFVVENTGEGTLSPVVINDDILGSPTCSPSLPASLPAPVAANDNHIAYCVVDGGTASAGYVVNTASATGTYGGSDYDSAEDKATYMNGNFGHLPSSYSNMNLFNEGGAFSLNGEVYLGSTVDTNDLDGINTATYTPKATDDGVTWTGNWSSGTGYANVEVTCPVGYTCYLYAWADWNQDSDFMDTNEAIYSGVVTDGTKPISFAYGGSDPLAAGVYYTRFRVYAALPDDPQPYGTALNATGAYLVGEIEDPFINSDGGGGTPTPVTLTYFRAQRQGESVTFTWSTATETSNIGFHLYVEEDGVRTRINPELIASQVVDSLERQDYSYTAAVKGNRFYIEDVSLWGETRMHGPFQLGVPYGGYPDEEAINWDEIRQMNSDLLAGQQEALKGELGIPEAALEPVKALGGGMQLASSLNLLVRETGIYRVTYEELQAAGLDLLDVPVRKITVTNRGKMIPVYVGGGSKFGPGGYIEFYAEGLDTIYTDTNVYTIQVNRTAAPQIKTGNADPKNNAGMPVSYFYETLVMNNQRAYGKYAPGNDAWFDTSMLVYTSAKSWSFPFEIVNLEDPSMPASMELVVWGVTDWPQSPDHRLVVSINGVAVADEVFNGLVEEKLQVNVPAGVLSNGENKLTLTLPGDTGAKYDMINLDRFEITYRRSFQAVDDRLTFTAEAKVFQVSNLTNGDVVIYLLNKGVPMRLDRVEVTADDDGTYTATFAGLKGSATYLVSTATSLMKPDMEAVRIQANLNQPATYLIIAHPDFIEGLQPLVDTRRGQGYTVSVVDVNDVYAQYSHGIFDPQAIREYIAHAEKKLGTEYVLLVGGDTYDYRNYLGKNSISFIPSLYMSTGPIANWVPVDPLYADVNGDYLPDLAIGRLPVRTNAELELVIGKTLAYENKDYGRTALFVSDRFDGLENFKNISNNLAFSLPEDWTVENIHLDDISVTDARSRLLEGMNEGVALVNFTGHSGPTSWTFSNLFNTSDAAGLANYGQSFVVVQWGCWNTYHVDPFNQFLVQKFLFSGDQGAAAVLGASTLTDSRSEEMLGVLLTPRLATPGMTIGEALLEAKVELARSNPELLDVLLGWSLMGDPTLVIEP